MEVDHEEIKKMGGKPFGGEDFGVKNLVEQIEKELLKIQKLLTAASTSKEMHDQLYVAQQALTWVLYPTMTQAAFNYITEKFKKS